MQARKHMKTIYGKFQVCKTYAFSDISGQRVSGEISATYAEYCVNLSITNNLYVLH